MTFSQGILYIYETYLTYLNVFNLYSTSIKHILVKIMNI
jgi:hypothetical protein